MWMGSKDNLLALGLRGKWDEVFYLLSESGPNVSKKITTELMFAGDNIIHIGIWKCTLDQLEKLIPWSKFGAHNHKNENYLHTAVKRGDVDIVKLVYKETGFQSLTMKNDMGETPLFLSAYQASFQCFDFLFDMFLKIPVPNDKSESGSYDCVLVRADGDNLLHVSLRNGFIDRANMIIKFFPHLVNLENKIGHLPLHDLATQYYVFKSGHPSSLVGSLLNKCANKMGFYDGKLKEKYDLSNKVAKEMTVIMNRTCLNSSNEDSLSQAGHQIISELPIIIAVKNGIVELVSEILNGCPADIKAKDGCGRNLIFIAVESRKPHMLEFLLKKSYGMNLTTETIEGGNNILHVAAIFPGETWDISGSGFQMLLEALWFERIRMMMPFHLRRLKNLDGKSPIQIFDETHKKLLDEGCEWFDIIFKAYGSVAPMTFITTIGLISIVSGGSGDIPFVVHHQTFVALAALAIAIVIVLQNDLLPVGSLFAGFVSTFVDDESYIGTLIRAPMQFTFRVLFVFIALGGLLLSFYLGQMLINNHDAIPLFGWAAFLPFMYLLFLSWPLLVDFANLGFGDLEYYVDRGYKDS